MVTWTGAPPPEPKPIGAAGWLRVVLRGGAILAVLAVCFPLLLLLRLPERAAFGPRRPVTPRITQGVCLFACAVMGLRRRVTGRAMQGPGVTVANHVTWLDIFVLNATFRGVFVAKSEVRLWPGIGWLARGTGTIFVDRDRRAAGMQQDALAQALAAGHRLILFPEGTSTDGLRVLPFKSTLFGTIHRTGTPVQPVTLCYSAPRGEAGSFYGWWGDMAFGPSLVAILAQAPQGGVEVTCHAPLSPAEFLDRKALAAAAETVVRGGLSGARR
ncbi:1-acyl-sn-glycerol-3-phosphate acyltransferase [Rhodobacterales bacterium HKCCE2091]|nr:1-acyl-sn-glycerol-3-phosphate acyltransferase [Rhodobacterales bacterium HKCCE2091]